LAGELRRQGLGVAGVASPRVLRGGETVGYQVRNLATGEERSLCSLDPPGIPFRRFFFSPDGLAFANAALERASQEADVVVVDEVGPLELAGEGFTPGLRVALASGAFLVLTVRPSLVDRVRTQAGLAEAAVVDLDISHPPPRTRDGTRALFDAMAATYDRGDGQAGPLAGSAESIARSAALVQVQAGERLLDIGVGTGAFAERVARLGAEVWGVDLSPQMLARCREVHPDYHLCEGHFLSLPVPDGSFHAIISSFAFHHLAPPEYAPAFEEILRVLVAGRRFVLLDILFASEADRDAARAGLGDLWDEEEIYPLIPEVVEAATSAGARDVTAHRVGALHWAITGTKPRGP